MPLPMPQRASQRDESSARSVTVRIGTLNVTSPPGCITPSAPQYTPRGAGSSARIAAIAARFGAPVTEPHGNSAAKSSASRRPGRVRARIVDVICHTVGSACSSNSRGTRTEPGSATRERSLRSRSTIMRFSARSFGVETRVSAAARSAASSAPRGAVPFIGCVVTTPSFQWKNSSGDTLDTQAGAPSTVCGRWIA
jgi:hypothetical protein